MHHHELTQEAQATYGEFIKSCAAHGISRGVAYDLLKRGLFDGFTFTIGVKRYVYAEGLRTLPQRLAKQAAAQRIAA